MIDGASEVYVALDGNKKVMAIGLSDTFEHAKENFEKVELLCFNNIQITHLHKWPLRLILYFLIKVSIKILDIIDR